MPKMRDISAVVQQTKHLVYQRIIKSNDNYKKNKNKQIGNFKVEGIHTKVASISLPIKPPKH